MTRTLVEKRRNENYIKYKYYKCTYLWIEIWSMAIKLSDPRTFRPVVTVVAVVIAPFFMAIIIATWSGGRSSAEPLGTWSGGSVVGSRRSRSRRGRRGRCGRSRSRHDRRGPWSMWSEIGGVSPRTKTCSRSASLTRAAFLPHTWMHVYRQVLVACMAVYIGHVACVNHACLPLASLL